MLMEKTVYIPIEESKITNEELVKFREIKKILGDVYDKLYEVYDKYDNFRELDIMLQKVEEAILWSHRVIALEIEDEITMQEALEKTEIKCDKEDCCKKEPCEKLDYKEEAKEILKDFINELKSPSHRTESCFKEKDMYYDPATLTWFIKI